VSAARGRKRTGATLALVGAAFGFSTITVFTALATNAGSPLLTVMTGRYAFATAFIIPLAGGFVALRLPAARAARLAGIGGLGQATIAFLSLSALAYIPAATLVFLFYTFPAWVALRAALLRSEPLTPQRVLSLAMSFGGVALMVGWPGAETVHPLGAGLSLSAAVVYALFIPLIDRLRAGIGPVVATAWVCIGATVIFALAAVLSGNLALAVAPVAWIAMLGLGLVSTVFAFVLFLKGLEVLGPVRTAIVTTAEPFFVALLAAIVLRQPIRVETVAGGALIAAAILILQRQPRGPA
jgi:drug/metabolite transporter (DMT)-like permease